MASVLWLKRAGQGRSPLCRASSCPSSPSASCLARVPRSCRTPDASGDAGNRPANRCTCDGTDSHHHNFHTPVVSQCRSQADGCANRDEYEEECLAQLRHAPVSSLLAGRKFATPSYVEANRNAAAMASCPRARTPTCVAIVRHCRTTVRQWPMIPSASRTDTRKYGATERARSRSSALSA